MTEYQHIYEKLVVLDGFLHKNDLSSAVTSIVEVGRLLESVEKKDEGNQSLLRLLRKAYKRKLLRIKTTLTQLVSKRVVIESDAISVYETLQDSSLSLASLFELLQPLELFDPEATWKAKTVYNFTAKELLRPIFQGGELVVPPLRTAYKRA